MSKTYFLETFGCQMNVADSELVSARLEEHGWTAVGEPEGADLVLWNTCSVRDHAEHKVRSRLGLAREWKKARPGMVLGLMGCMAQREKDDLLRRHPHLDLVVGTDRFVHLPQLLDQLAERGRLVAADFVDQDDRLYRARRPEGVNAWVPIMRGCNYACTYCVVPSTRGREKSRRMADIEEEVRVLAAAGHAQVTLLGQTVDAYGKTLGDGSSLAALLHRLHPIEGLRRIRFVTSHPLDIDDALLDAMAVLPKVAKHLHVPAQSGSDRILRLMGRRYTRADYLALVRRARARMPEVELLSDFIVGFPRETEADFQETVSLMEEVRFGGAYVFTYSPRPGTSATRLADELSETEKNRRCTALLDLQLQHQAAAYAALAGQVRQVLVEGPSKNDPAMFFGRSEGNLNIVIPAAGNADAIGQVVPVRIIRSTALTLFGERV